MDTLEGLEEAIDISHCIEDDGAIKILLLCEAQGEEIDYYQRDVKEAEVREHEKAKKDKENQRKAGLEEVDEEDESGDMTKKEQ